MEELITRYWQVNMFEIHKHDQAVIVPMKSSLPRLRS